MRLPEIPLQIPPGIKIYEIRIFGVFFWHFRGIFSIPCHRGNLYVGLVFLAYFGVCGVFCLCSWLVGCQDVANCGAQTKHRELCYLMCQHLQFRRDIRCNTFWKIMVVVVFGSCLGRPCLEGLRLASANFLDSPYPLAGEFQVTVCGITVCPFSGHKGNQRPKCLQNKAQMYLSRKCPFSNKTNLHLELPGLVKGVEVHPLK